MSKIQLREKGSRDFLDVLEDIFDNEGSAEYLGEAVSMAEHMLQTAQNAKNGGADDALITASLLHDIGHFAQVKAARSDWHRHHDAAVAEFLRGHFGPAVIEPARLHVEAKRYLCATDPDYIGQLSAASMDTLEKQGGPMQAGEIEEFESNPYFIDACRLRRWEEDGKNKDAKCPDFACFRPILIRTRID
jgi:phosphonate degradation associated HDIG domain protein